MKKIATFAIACAMVLGLTATNALAIPLDTSSDRYLGLINDGIPSNLSDAVVYLNTLLARPLSSGPTLVGTEYYTRTANTCPGGCPAAVLAGATKTDTPTGSGAGIDATGFTYLLGKYDAGNAGTRVWYVAGLTTVDIPNNFNGSQYGLSHYSLFNPGTSVPDGGATLMLLGGALAGLETLRRKLRA